MIKYIKQQITDCTAIAGYWEISMRMTDALLLQTEAIVKTPSHFGLFPTHWQYGLSLTD